MVDKGTFGSETRFPSLAYIHNNLEKLEKNRKEYVGSLMQDLHSSVKSLQDIKDARFRDHVIHLVRRSFSDKVRNLRVSDKMFITHLDNYVRTRLKIELSYVKKR